MALLACLATLAVISRFVSSAAVIVVSLCAEMA